MEENKYVKCPDCSKEVVVRQGDDEDIEGRRYGYSYAYCECGRSIEDPEIYKLEWHPLDIAVAPGDHKT